MIVSLYLTLIRFSIISAIYIDRPIILTPKIRTPGIYAGLIKENFFLCFLVVGGLKEEPSIGGDLD